MQNVIFLNESITTNNIERLFYKQATKSKVLISLYIYTHTHTHTHTLNI